MATHPRLPALLLAVLGVLLGGAAPAGAGETPLHDRLYLLGADTDYLYWSADPLEPEFAATQVTRACGLKLYGTPGYHKPCLSGILGGRYAHAIFFFPGTLLDAPAAWSSASPLRFRLALTVDSPQPYTVHFGIQKGTTQAESQPATQSSPGVWEGALAGGSPLGLETVNLLYVRIRTLSPRITMTLGARGASYAELPEAVPARAVSRLLAESTYAPEPTSLATPHRGFTFNDDAWSLRSFPGDLTQTRNFELALDRDAAIVLGWVEVFDTPFLFDVLSGRPPDTRKLKDTPVTHLYRDGEEIAHGGNTSQQGRGGDTLAATAVPAGTLRLEVAPVSGSEGHPYTAYLLAVEGDRTLASMRWRFHNPPSGAFVPHRSPISAGCPASLEVVPTTPETTTFSVDVDWDSQSLLSPA